MFIYNPADPELPQTFHYDAKEYQLEPNATQELADEVGNRALVELQAIGVIAVSGDAKADKDLVAESERRHAEYLLKRFGPVLEEAAEKERIGLRVASPEVEMARRVLKDWELLK